MCVWIYSKVIGEKTKSHQNTVEDLRRGGIILFKTNSDEFNGGMYMNHEIKIAIFFPDNSYDGNGALKSIDILTNCCVARTTFHDGGL